MVSTVLCVLAAVVMTGAALWYDHEVAFEDRKPVAYVAVFVVSLGAAFGARAGYRHWARSQDAFGAPAAYAAAVAACAGRRGALGDELESAASAFATNQLKSDRGYALPAALRATSATEVRFAVCVDSEIEVIEVCRYSGGGTFERRQSVLDVRVVDLLEGRSVAREFRGKRPGSCPTSKSHPGQKGHYQVPEGIADSDVTAWLEQVAQGEADFE